MIESEFILLRQFVSKGDAEAFAKIIKQHAPMVYGVCLRILEDNDKAADAVQDTFFQLVRDAAEITGSLPNWLHRVATYRAIDLIRTESQRKQRESIYIDNSGKMDSQDEKAAWREISGYIDEELDNLDELTREVIILHFFESQTMTSIAEKFCISQQTVSRRIDSGVVSLRQNFKSRGVIVSVAILTALLTENIVHAAPASIMKELGKIAIAGCRDARPYASTIGTKIASSISAGIAVKMKIMVGMLIVLLGAGLTVISSFIANGENKPASTWELVNKSLRNESKPEPSDNITALELIDKYSQTRAKLRTSYLSKGTDTVTAEISTLIFPQFQKGVKYKNVFKIELCSDGKNYYALSKHWGDNPLIPGGITTEVDVASNQMLWNGELLFQYHDNPDASKAVLYLTVKEQIKNKQELDALCDGQNGGPIRGLFYGSAITIDKELRHADSISVRPEKENINGSDCYVIDAKDKRSEFVIWIDPEHGYNIAQANINRNSATANDPNIYKDPETGTSQFDIKNVIFKDMNGVWLPVECDYSVKLKFDNGDYTLENHYYKITEFIINPDHKALKSFDPNNLVKNGAQVRLINLSNAKYTWKDGKVIDSYGYEVNLSTLKPPSLLGKTLPSIAEYGVNLEPDVFKNNMLLICFFDYSQRPSRNCVLALNEKTQSLLDKDIFLIFIQSDSINDGTLDNWLRQNEIVPPVEKSKITLSELGHRWGVQSLPWLILTDKNHIVTDEGFPLTELDKKIK